MTRTARFAVAFSVLCLLAAAGRVSADTITITTGALDVVIPAANLSISGSQGFTLQSQFDIQGGTFVPWDQCHGLCAPGDTLNLRGVWSGGDLPATATLNRETYLHVGSGSANSSALVQFAGSAVLPAYAGGANAFIQAPFTFSGLFSTDDQGRRDLVGSGIASIWLTPDNSFNQPSWRPTEVRYDFAVTPEPGSVILLGSGLLLFGWIVLRRRGALAR